MDALGDHVEAATGIAELRRSNAHCWIVGSFPAPCQDEVFADPDLPVPGTPASQGRATRIDGGWRLDGRWQFASGVDLGEWVMVGAIADELPDSPTRLYGRVRLRLDPGTPLV